MRVITEILGQMFVLGLTIAVGVVVYFIVSSIVASYITTSAEMSVVYGHVNVNPSSPNVFAIEVLLSSTAPVLRISSVTVWHGDSVVNSTCLDCSSLLNLRGGQHDLLQVTIIARSSRQLQRGDLLRVELTVTIGREERKLYAIIRYAE